MRTTHDTLSTIRSGILLGIVSATLFLSSMGAHAATASRTSAFEYDPVSGLLTKEIIEPDDPNLCQVTTYTYDSFGNKNSATTRNCNGSAGSHPGTNSEAAAPTTGTPAGADAIIVSSTSTTTYDTQGRFATSSTNALNQTETKTYNGNFGTVASLTGPNGLTTSWTYDSFGRVTNEARADGTSTQTAYTACTASTCDVKAAYYIVKTQAGAPTSVSYFDIHHHAIIDAAQDKDSTWIYTVTNYDKLGRTSSTSRPFKAAATMHFTSITYDLLGRPLTTTAPDGTVTTATYNGLSTTMTNAKGQAKTEVKNTQGQLASVTDANGKTLTYGYDPFGNLTKTTDALGNITTISYDKRGRKIGMDDPDQGVWSYRYDVLGQLKTQIDAKNQTVTFQYDKLGRMTQRNEPEMVSKWYYDTCDATLNSGGKCIGKPTRETSDNGGITLVAGDPGYIAGDTKKYQVRLTLYDTLGRPTGQYDSLEATALNSGWGITKSYDAFGRLDQLTYPTGLLATRHVYSANGHLVGVKNNATNLMYWQAAGTTDAEGRINQFTYGNGITTTTTVNNMGRITQIAAGASNAVSNQSFVYDSIGNITQRYDGATNLNESFGYDNLNRLISTSAQAGSGPLTSVTLTYNEIGNIMSKSDVGTYTYASLKANGSVRPHAVSKIMMADNVTVYANYTYDANGNMLTSLDSANKGRTFTWTSWNMVNSIVGNKPATANPALLSSTPINTTTSTFAVVYNAAHERIKETLPNGTIVYNISPRVDTGIHVERRIKPDGTIQTVASLYAGGMPFGTVTTVQPPRDGTPTTYTRYFHTDHLGSIVAISDEAGTVTERRSYDAWGKRRNLNGTPTASAFVTPDERHGFTGHEELDELGLIHMNGRLYDPTTGRFISADPTIQFADDMQNYNRYSYIMNNPLSTVDMSGYGIFKSIKKAFKKIFKGVKKLLSNKVVRIAVAAAAAWYIGVGPDSFGLFGGNTAVLTAQGPMLSTTLGASIANGAAAGFTFGFVSSGGNIKAGISGAISGGALAGIGSYFDGHWTFGRVAANSFAGGTMSKLNGGNFVKGMIDALKTNMMRMGFEYTRLATDQLKFAACASGTSGEVCRYNMSGELLTDGTRGLNQVSLDRFNESMSNLPRPVAWLLKSISGVGMGREGYGPEDICLDGTACGHVYSPNGWYGSLINLVSKPHDFWNSWTYGADGLRTVGSPSFEAGFNLYSFVGMPIAGTFTAKSLTADWSFK